MPLPFSLFRLTSHRASFHYSFPSLALRVSVTLHRVRVLSLSLQHFRSYDEAQLECFPSAQMFVGKNGSGKTNILEALSILSQGRSCLRADLLDVIRFENLFFRISAEVEQDDGMKKKLECIVQSSPRRASAYFIQDIRTPLLQFIGALPTIVFLPQDMDIFSGPPSLRRSFLDSLLAQLYPEYASLRVEYERILKQRNALLKSIADAQSSLSDLDLWDEQLAQAAVPILQRRLRVFSAYNKILHHEVARLGQSWTQLMCQPIFTTGLFSAREDLQAALLRARSRDVLVQTTSVGPHRDDWLMQYERGSVALFASRGEQRTTFLALLFASARLFQEFRAEKPVLLLDDVLSELDQDHQEALLTHFSDHQMFMTSVHQVPSVTSMQYFSVVHGHIERMVAR